MTLAAGVINLVGMGVVTYGSWLAHPAAGWIVGGLCLCAWAASILKLEKGDGEKLP